MKKTLRKFVLTSVTAFTAFALAACGNDPAKNDNPDNGGGQNPAKKEVLTIAYANFSEKFSPFFAESAYDTDVYGMTQVGLLAGDRGGAIIKDGINGETVNYNGKDYTYYGLGKVDVKQNNGDGQDGSVDYTIEIRSGDKQIYFSDGKPVTLNDVFFTMYALSDNDYDGSSTFYSLPIEGMGEYRTGLKTNVYNKYKPKADGMAAAFADGDKGKDYVPTSDDAFTGAEYSEFKNRVESQGWKLLAEDIVGYCKVNYPQYLPAFGNNEVANGMGLWGFGDFGTIGAKANGRYGKVNDKMVQLYNKVAADTEGATKIGDDYFVKAKDGEDGDKYYISAQDADKKPTATAKYEGADRLGDVDEDAFYTSAGKRFTLVGNDVPQISDYVDALKAGYDGDFVAAAGKEAANSDTAGYLDEVATNWMMDVGATEMAGQTVDTISGITKISDNKFNIHMTRFEATSIYHLGMSVAPLHYYGDESKFNFAQNKFGFDKGDLNKLREKTTKPMGAGPYKFVSYKDGLVTFEANEKYWEGAPKIKNVVFKEYNKDEDKTPAVQKGDIDIASPSISKDVCEAIKKGNSNGQLTGDVITTDLIDYNGYGYIGMSANRVKVGADKGNAASCALRNAIATIFASFREYTVNSYYEDRASVINYPISNCSWAAPQPNDSGYAVAYAKDVNGNPIYTADMSDEAKVAAATNAAKGFLQAAGYTFGADGKATAAPDGAKLSYEAWIPADGSGDHPSFQLLVKSQEQLEKLGIELVIKDLSNSSALWDGLDADNVDIWCAAWGGSSDPDMYQIYHSSNKTGSNHYHIASDALDELIMKARASDDTAYRKGMYKQALDEVLRWGVEIPVYQRKDCVIYNTKSVNIDSLTPDRTPYWGYLSEVHTLEVK